MKRFLCGLVALGLFVGTAGQANADYIYTTLDFPGATSTRAYGINASGQIVGSYYAGGTHAFLLDQGSYTTLNLPSSFEARGINDAGQIVGSYLAGTVHGFLYSGNSYITLDAPGATAGATFADGINNAGQIVGEYAKAFGTPNRPSVVEIGFLIINHGHRPWY